MKTVMSLRWRAGLALAALFLVSAASSVQAASKKVTPTGTTEPYAQTPYDPANAVGVGFNGTPCTLHGLDYKPDGVTLNYISPIVSPPAGIVYTDKVVGTVTYKVESVQTVVNGVPVTTPTGTIYRVDTGGWVGIVPGAALQQLTKGAVAGTSDASPMGLNVDGMHKDEQFVGGITNEEPNRSNSLEGLIRAVKDSATKFVDLSAASCFANNDGSFGTADNPALVYCSGRKNANGTFTEDGLHLSGTFHGYGVLIIEVDDPENASPCVLDMSGNSEWTGLVMVVCTKNPTGNKQPLAFVGGGQSQHIVGGAFLYMRNQKRNPSDTSSLIGMELVKLAGNGDIRYSGAAIDAAFKLKPSAMQVRSWRKLAENE